MWIQRVAQLGVKKDVVDGNKDGSCVIVNSFPIVRSSRSAWPVNLKISSVS